MEPLQHIEKRMNAKGVTVYRLHKMTGIPKSSLESIFKHRNPTLCLLTTICTALDMELIIKPVKPHKQ